MQSSVYFGLKGRTTRKVTGVFAKFIADGKFFLMHHMEHCISRNHFYCLLKGQIVNILGTVYYPISVTMTLTL